MKRQTERHRVVFTVFSTRCVRQDESSRYCHNVRSSVRLGWACIAW